MLFLPRENALNAQARAIIADEMQRHSLEVLTWRTVVHEPNVLGKRAFETLPDIQQVLIERPSAMRSELEFDQFLFLVRSRIQNRIFRETGAKRHASLPGFYIPSMSCRTVTYKALVSAPQLRRFYLDLNDPDFKVSHILFHQRYSTNTLPTWERAQPFRFMCHNGEINTLQGNINWMKAREPMLDSLVWGSDIEDLKPIIDEASSDSGMFDNVLELLTLAGRDITHAVKMMIPQAWEKDPDMPPAVKGFFRYHAALMEPWDGPASIVFTDGARVGMTLDRNGLRPARYIHTSDGIVYAGSEIGALDVDPEKIIASGKLGPGTMICADLQSRRLLTNDDILKELSTRKPYRDVAARQRVRLEEVANLTLEQPAVNSDALLVKQAQFGWTSEELTMIV
jgi:glutamate synthase domain-containing protein 1